MILTDRKRERLPEGNGTLLVKIGDIGFYDKDESDRLVKILFQFE